MGTSLAIHSSTPPFAAASTKPWTTSSFTPPVDSLLVATVAADWFSTTPTISVTSSGLTFTQQQRQGGASGGVCEIWTCAVGAAGGTARTVSATTSLVGSNEDTGGLKVWVLTGQHASFVDAVGGFGPNNTADPANPVMLTTVNPGAWVFGCGTNWVGSTTNVASAEPYEQYADADLTVMGCRKMYEQAVPGAVVMNFDQIPTGTSPQWVGAAIAIRPDSYTADPPLPGERNALAPMLSKRGSN